MTLEEDRQTAMTRMSMIATKGGHKLPRSEAGSTPCRNGMVAFAAVGAALGTYPSPGMPDSAALSARGIGIGIRHHEPARLNILMTRRLDHWRLVGI
jgi:hypothetical protein